MHRECVCVCGYERGEREREREREICVSERLLEILSAHNECTCECVRTYV